MPAELNPQVVDSVTTDNIKTIAEAGAHSIAVAMQNLVSFQQVSNSNLLAIQNAAQQSVLAQTQALTNLMMATTGAIVKNLLEVDPGEAISVQKELSGNDTAQMLAQLLAALNSGQQGVKSAQTTPPVTP